MQDVQSQIQALQDQFARLEREQRFGLIMGERIPQAQLTGGHLGSSSVQGGKLVTVTDDRSAACVFPPAAQNSNSAGPWYQFTNDIYYYQNTTTRGDGAVAPSQSVSYSFVGTQIQVIAAKSPDSGKIDVLIDGTLNQTVDCYAGVWLARAIVASVTGLASGKHTVQVNVRTDHNASSAGYKFYFDAFRSDVPLGMSQVDIAVLQVGASGTLDANGYAYADMVNYAPSGYSSLGVCGAALTTPNPDTPSTTVKPKIGWDGRYVYLWDGAANGAVAVTAFLIVMRS